ncbi:hypothetical protein AMTRI_Chr05g73580 [Amborella trichopoda]
MHKRDICFFNRLLNSYCRSSSLKEARELFEQMPERNAVSWCTMISGYGKSGEIHSANKLFNEIPEKNLVSFNAMLSAYLNCGRLESATKLFDEMPQKNPATFCTMIAGFSRLGFVERARTVFYSIPFREQSVISWTAMITGYVQNDQNFEALKLFLLNYGEFYSFNIKPNSFTFNLVLKSCSILLFLSLGKQIHGTMIKFGFDGYLGHVFVQNSLMNFYAKLGELVDAEKIFNGMREKKDLGSWNTLMAGYACQLNIDKAMHLFSKMENRDTLSWNIIIQGLADNDRIGEALECFLSLAQSWPELKPNPSTYSIVISLSTTLTALELGSQIHTHTVKFGLYHRNVFIGNAFISMYSRCGLIEESENVFQEMLERDIVTWNSFILGLGQNGFAKKALTVADKVLHIANHNTFTGILTACSHGGLVNEGFKYFNSMANDHGIEPNLDHYTCMIDLLGRAGRLNEALELLQNMPFMANCVAWGTLLGACLIHGDAAIGKLSAQKLIALEPEDIAGWYVLLAKIYTKTGKLEEAREIRKMIRERGLKKEPGCSWIRMRNKVHGFVAQDMGHPQRTEVYWILEILNKEMREEGG